MDFRNTQKSPERIMAESNFFDLFPIFISLVPCDLCMHDCEIGINWNHICIKRNWFIDIADLFLATNFYEQFKNIDSWIKKEFLFCIVCDVYIFFGSY